jgi:hypothetical protein
MFTKLSEHFEFRHFRPHYLDVDHPVITLASKRAFRVLLLELTTNIKFVYLQAKFF